MLRHSRTQKLAILAYTDKISLTYFLDTRSQAVFIVLTDRIIQWPYTMQRAVFHVFSSRCTVAASKFPVIVLHIQQHSPHL